MKRALAIMVALCTVGFASFAMSFTGSWTAKVCLVPAITLESAVTLNYSVAGIDFTSISSFDGTGRVWHEATGEHLRTLSGHTSSVFGVAISNAESNAEGNGRVYTASSDGTCRVYRRTTPKDYAVSANFRDGVFALTHVGDFADVGRVERATTLLMALNRVCFYDDDDDTGGDDRSPLSENLRRLPLELLVLVLRRCV